MKLVVFLISKNKWSHFISLHVLCCSDDEDDTAELLAELQRIKKERAQEEARKVQCKIQMYTYYTFQ